MRPVRLLDEWPLSGWLLSRWQRDGWRLNRLNRSLPISLVAGALVWISGPCQANAQSPAKGVSAAGTTLRTETLERGRTARLRLGAVSAEVELVPVKGDPQLQDAQLQTVVTVMLKGQAVGELRGPVTPRSMQGAAVVQIAELDTANVYPEVLLSAFTGGAHCCNQTQVLTRPRGEPTWSTVELGPFDGGPMPARIPMGGNVPLVVSVDNRFLYKFACYACGGAPARLWQLKAGRFVDVSHQRRYRPIYQQAVKRMQAQLQEPIQPNDNPNGWLAAYVANMAMVGELQQGWMQMLERYSRQSDWGLKECLGGYGKDGCNSPEVVYPTYPDALRAFLKRTGYWQ